MKILRYAVCLLILMGVGNRIAIAAERSDFRFEAFIQSGEESNVPVRLALAHNVIAETSRGFADLRLFDNLGVEIPYVIYTQHRPERPAAYFTWKVVDYQSADGTQIIFLERPVEGGAFTDVKMITTARDFQKVVTVYASDDRRFWKQIAADMVFDFSSHIDLRKTALELPETDALYLKVILKDTSKVIEHGEDIRLRYKDLEFTLSGVKTGDIKIDGFSSHIGRRSPEEPYFDQAVFTHPKMFLDQDGNTVVALGRVNLPVERASLKIKNAYYYRRIELWVAETDEETAYARVAQDVVYRIPGISEAKHTLSFHQPQHAYVRLKVINHDNPPLQVEEVTITWVRRNLYFIPEAGRRYTLYCGGKDIRPPHYESQRLVPNRYDQLMRYAEWKVSALQENEVYKPKVDLRSKAKFEQYLLTMLMIVLACGMAYWTFRLMKKIPERH